MDPALQSLDITVSTCGRGSIVLGDSAGEVYMFDRALSCISFTSYQEEVTHLFQMKTHNLLLSAGVCTPCALGLRPWGCHQSGVMYHWGFTLVFFFHLDDFRRMKRVALP